MVGIEWHEVQLSALSESAIDGQVFVSTHLDAFPSGREPAAASTSRSVISGPH